MTPDISQGHTIRKQYYLKHCLVGITREIRRKQYEYLSQCINR